MTMAAWPFSKVTPRYLWHGGMGGGNVWSGGQSATHAATCILGEKVWAGALAREAGTAMHMIHMPMLHLLEVYRSGLLGAAYHCHCHATECAICRTTGHQMAVTSGASHTAAAAMYCCGH
jgi:hypothetical protein